ncbi:MAG: IS200/IS605 family element transposase accessory protein TnpB [Chloroflexi bacterium]|nr:IS200/IS605 family element transposase accessory protein TnpB [Chloroflexota bacterium]
MLKAFKYRLYPNCAQTAKLNQTLDICRTLYNACLEQRRTGYRQHRKAISATQQMAELPDLKQALPEVGEVYSQVLQDVLWRVDTAFGNFFRRVRSHQRKAGYPRFQSHNRYDSFTYPQFGFSIAQGRLGLSKIGNIKIKLHRPIEGTVKTCTLKRKVDEWYVIFACEVPDAEPSEPTSVVGIDVGIEWFLATSDGAFIENPRLLDHSLRKLRKLQRSLSRKKLGSKNRNKARILVAKQNRTVRRQRLDFQHKVARTLVNQYDVIAVEDLNVMGLVKNHSLARHIADAGWAGFANILEHKAAYAGGRVIRVNPAYTSQVCSGCGCIVRKELSERWHACPDCGLSIHRDTNAARNILKAAGTPPLGGNVAERIASVAQEAHVF